jgi:hypothetical protein
LKKDVDGRVKPGHDSGEGKPRFSKRPWPLI